MELKTIKAIHDFFKNNQIPIYYISSSNANLINIGDWVNNFHHINVGDSFDNQFPNLKYLKAVDLKKNVSVTELALDNFDILKEMKNNANTKLVFLSFDKNTEDLAKKYNFEVFNPPFSLFQKLDNKAKIMLIIEQLQIPTTPYIISEIKSYCHLLEITEKLGNDLVIQSQFGSSGLSTFFIDTERAFEENKSYLITGTQMKIMKRIKCHQFTIDACATRLGTIIGPLMTELIGLPELTFNKGGWCGNEIYQDIVDQNIRKEIYLHTKKLGDYLYNKEKFRGCFGIDFLLDIETNTLYFGELNPRITGCGLITNQILNSYEIPLFLFHLMEYFNIDYNIDVKKFNLDWEYRNLKSYSQLIINSKNESEELTKNIKSGIWKKNGNNISFDRFDYRLNSLSGSEEAIILNVPPFHTTNKGDFLARVVFQGQAKDNNGQLTKFAHEWIQGFRAQIL